MWISSRRFQLYHILSTPSNFHNVRIFCYDVPLILKISDRTVSTESDAIRFIDRISRQQNYTSLMRNLTP
jgi:hypothetical protein